jgi:5'-nucleotidase / UDP-sugar diphosphatase
MKKIALLLLLVLIVFNLSACIEKDIKDNGNIIDESTPLEFLDIFYVNDLHGAILPEGNRMGFAHIANLLIAQKQTYPENTLILSGGDMVHGSALSNHYLGESMIHLMNASLFDAMAIGNHEFDWGLETVSRYFNPESAHYVANFPMLGANVHYKGTNDMPAGIDPYTIITKGDMKIGIIGIIGYGLERSISTRFVEDYEFKNPVPIVKEYATYLRTEEGVDLVLLLTHDAGGVNDAAFEFVGDAKVDAIFNAHSHRVESGFSYGIPAIQSGGYGSHVGHIRFEIDNKLVTDVTMSNYTQATNGLLTSAHPGVQTLINQYVFETDAIFNEPIIYTNQTLYRNDLTYWMSTLMRTATNADIGFHNTGGTRTNIEGNAYITLSTLYDVWPFDNEVITTYLTGAQIKNLMGRLDYYSTEITYFNDTEYYKVATNDYLFFHNSYSFKDGTDSVETTLFLRDLAYYELKNQALIYSTFSLSNPILTTYIPNQNNQEDTVN